MAKKHLVSDKMPDLMTKEEAWALKRAYDEQVKIKKEELEALIASAPPLEELPKTSVDHLNKWKNEWRVDLSKLAYRLGVPPTHRAAVSHQAFDLMFEELSPLPKPDMFAKLQDEKYKESLITRHWSAASSNPQAAATQSKLDQIDAMLATPDLPKHGYYGERSLRVRRAALVVKLNSLK